MAIYGHDGTPCPLVTLRVTAPDGVSVLQSGYYLFGREVASAKGRDTGARQGAGVVLLRGGAKSGGSVKNWRTLLLPGTTFKLRDVPDYWIEDGLDYPGLTIERVPAPAVVPLDRAALSAVRASLAVRMTEIDALLAQPENAA